MNIAVPVSAVTPHIPLRERTAVTFMGTPGAFAGPDIRRHRIGRETLEYTGTGRELLIGFMIALAVLAPMYVPYFVLGIAAEALQTFASVPLFLILYVFGHYAAFRARRYRATRTVFRGVRFWVIGSALAYAGKAIFWDLSLGLAPSFEEAR